MIKKLLVLLLIIGSSCSLSAQKKDKSDKEAKDSTDYKLINGVKVPRSLKIIDSITIVRNNIVKRTKDTLKNSEVKATPKGKGNSTPGSKIASVQSSNSAQTFDNSISAGRVNASLDVSSSGAAVYIVPISVPPGIGGVVPQVALNYSSQAGNGLAGYGWNIAGTSSITRIPQSMFHDNLVGGISFSNNDRFALDGQRLILKSGTYGADGAEYQTENFSNTKIISRGTLSNGPEYFEVIYPDGSKSFYGMDAGSRSPTDFALSYTENANGLRISYTYTSSNNILLIYQIKYGSKGSATAINEIRFIYKDRQRTEQVFISGQSFAQTKILSHINVLANYGGTNYRSYLLTHNEVETLKYERITMIQEFSENNEKSFEPLLFQYTNTNSILVATTTTGLGLTGATRYNSNILANDFTGNGRTDIILYPTTKNKLWLFWDPVTGSPLEQAQLFEPGYFHEIASVTYLNAASQAVPTPGFTLIKSGLNPGQTKFPVYSAGLGLPSVQYEKEWTAPWVRYGYYSSCAQEYTFRDASPPQKDYLSGDFNGDGLTDVLAVDKPYAQITSDYLTTACSTGQCCETVTQYTTSSDVYFINLDRRLTSNFANKAGTLYKTIYGESMHYTGDFTGDGKTDVLQVTNGSMTVSSLSAGNNLIMQWHMIDTRITLDYPSLLGDYNGDGKTDIMFPTADVNPGHNVFAVFMSTGTGFVKQEKTYPFYNKRYSVPNAVEFIEYSLVPSDMNGDGKTDMVHTMTHTFNNSTDDQLQISIFENISSETGSAPVFGPSVDKTDTLSLMHYPNLVFLDNQKPNFKLEFGVLSDNSVSLYEYTKNLRTETELSSVTQDGVTYAINYKPLNEDYSNGFNLYESSSSHTFPHVNIKTAPGLRVASKLTRTFNTNQTQQLFAYRNAVSHTAGLGFLGFGKLVRSSWHLAGNSENKFFNTSIHDPLLRGAVLKQFSSKSFDINTAVTGVNAPVPDTTLSQPSSGQKTIIATNSITLLPGFEANGANGTFIARISDPSNPVEDGGTSGNYITRTDYTYDTQLLTSKVFINKPTSVITKDILSGTSNTVLYTYDSYNNVTKEVTNFSGAGTKTVDITYDNNPIAGYIGRPLTKKTKLNNSGDTYTTEEEYSYTGFLPTQVKRKGHNTPFITENLQYDTFGNLTQKSVTAGSSTRTSQMQYDASGRFVTKTIDAEGLETTFQYNTSTGNLTTKTDPYNLSSTYLYDVWGRPVQSTNFLGKSSYTVYEKDGSSISITQTSDEGTWSTKSVNALGQTKLVREKDVLGQLVGKSYQYDIYDRPTGESEPSTSGSYSQWNTTEYDEYGRVKKSTSYTGKETNIGYSNLTTTVNDGTKTVITTKNALGNVITVTDPGGTITNTYFANGNLKSAGFEGSTQSIEQDGWGRKTKLTDPSAGVYTYTYNDFGETLTEGTPKGVTTYTYDTNGKQLTKQIYGDATGMTYQYNYDGTTKLLTSTGLTNTDGNNTTYTYTYDTYKRISSTKEDNLHAIFTKTLTYDSFGRVSTETSEAKNKQNNKIASRTILNTYQYGELKSITDNTTSEKIWEVSTLNARGQVTAALLGSTMKQTNAYDQYGYATELKTERLGSNPAVLMQLGYSFDPQRGNLNSRSNSVFSWSETFGYDSQDRLTTFNDNNANLTQSYDNRGRINNNSAIGNYVFNGISYQQTGLTSPTPAATWHYHNRPLQEISYNAFKSPVEIKEQGKERISFQYNGGQGRSHMYYGDEQADKDNRRYRRHYSEEGSMEITEDLTGNTTSFIFYMGGDAYDAPAIWKEVHSSTGTTQNLYYLHRDHLGSINLITDNQGTAVEKRQFDAWGNIVKLTDGNGNDLTAFVITERGYTGHEHLLGVGLIHMNGRLYDPKLHRFLQPDNYVQDPSNSQNYNRYGYVLNNPLKFTDPTGEFLWVPFLIGAAIGAYSGGTLANNGQLNPGKWDWNSGKTWGYMLGGGLTGGFAGAAAGSIATSGIAFSNTAAIAAGSAINSVGTFLYTGGKTDLSVSFGVGSFNFSTGELGYLGKKGNSFLENVGYGLGAIANAQDILAGLNPGNAQIQTENTSTAEANDKIGHFQVLDDKGQSLIDYGPFDAGTGQYFGFSPGRNNWVEFASGGQTTQTIDIAGNLHNKALTIRGVNMSRLTRISNHLKADPGSYNFLLKSCSSVGSRALTASGYFAIGGIHPYLLRASIILREAGLRPSLYSHFLNQ